MYVVDKTPCKQNRSCRAAGTQPSHQESPQPHPKGLAVAESTPPPIGQGGPPPNMFEPCTSRWGNGAKLGTPSIGSRPRIHTWPESARIAHGGSFGVKWNPWAGIAASLLPKAVRIQRVRKARRPRGKNGPRNTKPTVEWCREAVPGRFLFLRGGATAELPSPALKSKRSGLH